MNVERPRLSYIFSPQGVYYQTGDVIQVIDEDDGKPYYAQIRGFVQDQYCEKSAALTWLIPTQASPKDQFDPSTYILGEHRKTGRLLFLRHVTNKNVFSLQVQKKICLEKWSTWSLCVMLLLNISSHGALRFPPSLSVQKKATSGLT